MVLLIGGIFCFSWHQSLCHDTDTGRDTCFTTDPMLPAMTVMSCQSPAEIMLQNRITSYQFTASTVSISAASISSYIVCWWILGTSNNGDITSFIYTGHTSKLDKQLSVSLLTSGDISAELKGSHFCVVVVVIVVNIVNFLTLVCKVKFLIEPLGDIM